MKRLILEFIAAMLLACIVSFSLVYSLNPPDWGCVLMGLLSWFPSFLVVNTIRINFFRD